MKPEVAVFTKESPCTKVHIHLAFSDAGAYVPTPVVDYKAVAGANSIKYLLKNAYAREFLHQGVDYYELTPEGKSWLTKGLARHLELHPEDIGLLARPGGGQSPGQSPNQSPLQPQGRGPRVIRRSQESR